MKLARVKKVVRALMHVPDRVLHPLRRRDAIGRLRSGSAWHGQVLFICHGNVCRSPFGEFLFEQRVRALGPVGAGFSAASAGFVGPDRSSPPEAIAAAARLGLDLRPHRSKLMSGDMLHASSLIIVMSASQAASIQRTWPAEASKVLVLGDLDPLPIATRTVHDPWKGTAEVFDQSYARIERCVHVLIECIVAESTARQVPPTMLLVHE